MIQINIYTGNNSAKPHIVRRGHNFSNAAGGGATPGDIFGYKASHQKCIHDIIFAYLEAVELILSHKSARENALNTFMAEN